MAEAAGSVPAWNCPLLAARSGRRRRQGGLVIGRCRASARRAPLRLADLSPLAKVHVRGQSGGDGSNV